MKRNEFLKACCLSVVGASSLATFLQSCAGANYFAQAIVSDNKLVIHKTEFIKIENEKTHERKFVIVKTDKLNFPVCVFKINNDNYTALLMECTHKGCELNPAGNYLVCPCHGSEFNNQGIVQNPPAEENLKSFLITTDNDNIYIQL